MHPGRRPPPITHLLVKPQPVPNARYQPWRVLHDTLNTGGMLPWLGSWNVSEGILSNSMACAAPSPTYRGGTCTGDRHRLYLIRLTRGANEQVVTHAEWRDGVLGFVTQIDEFYCVSAAKVEAEGKDDREGWRGFWREWGARTEKAQAEMESSHQVRTRSSGGAVLRMRPARARVILFHVLFTCFLFLCMMEALYYPLVGHPRWWHVHILATFGEFIGHPPFIFGIWLLKYIPWVLSNIFAWLLALIWAVILPIPLTFVLLRRCNRYGPGRRERQD